LTHSSPCQLPVHLLEIFFVFIRVHSCPFVVKTPKTFGPASLAHALPGDRLYSPLTYAAESMYIRFHLWLNRSCLS
jgi:hypothetical protein